MARPTPLAPFDPVDQRDVEHLASSPAFDELLDALVNGTTEQAGGDWDQHPWQHLRTRSTARRVRWAVTVAAAAAVTAVLWVVVTPTTPAPSSHPPFTTAWSPAQPLPAAGQPSRSEHHGTWQLVDELLSGKWTQNVDGPPPGAATCPTAQACYKLAGTYASSAVNARLLSLSLYVSTDAGATWSVLPAPSGFTPTSPLSCGSATWCAAGGTYDGEAVLLSTGDGGHTFSVDPLPGGVGEIYELSCPAAGTCNGLVSTQSRANGAVPSTVTVDATFLTTDDGGKTFSDRPMIAGDSMSAIDCHSALDCTVVGVGNGPLAFPRSTSVVATTTDGGQTWQAGSFPAGFYTWFTSPLSCANAMDCSVVGAIPISDNLAKCTSGSQTATPPVMSPTVSVLSAVESRLYIQASSGAGSGGTCSPSVVSDIATTTDGGHTWTPEQLPQDVPDPSIDGLSCPTANECWASGTALAPRQIGKVSNMDSPVLLGTTDGGATWSKVTFSVPSTAPNPTGQSYQSIGAVTCPTATICLATGAAAAGASVAPVYSWVTAAP